MDRKGGICFGIMFALIGWAFGPFDTQPQAALIVACVLTVGGLGASLRYYLKRKD